MRRRAAAPLVPPPGAVGARPRGSLPILGMLKVRLEGRLGMLKVRLEVRLSTLEVRLEVIAWRYHRPVPLLVSVPHAGRDCLLSGP